MSIPTPELVVATEAALERHGWGGLTAELVAEAAGLNRVTLYRRGHSTQQLLLAAAMAAADEFKHRAVEALTQSGTASERLQALLNTLYQLADDHLALLAGLYDGPTAVFHLTGGEHMDPDIATRFEYTEPFERLLLDGNNDGTLRSTNPREDAELLFNTAGWTYVHLRRSHGWSERKARKAVTRLVIAYVAIPS
jgi:AcrR family transcriptional regulator